MGIVYLAKDPVIGRLVALKTIRPAANYDDEETREFQQRFVREAQAAGILNHPSIVTVFDIGKDDTTGINFIAMEYVEGSNLKEILSQGRPLSFDQVGEVIAQVADALDFAHSKGIVHRDVKPANIILLDNGRAKIMDFGIAKIASGGGNLTSTGQFLGTPNYMAPEQIKGLPVDGRTDLFSLGICLYECLTRRKPFGGDSLTSISYKIVHEAFPPLHEINPQIPSGYEDVVANCLAKDPPRRFQRGRDLANALRAVVRGDRPPRPEALSQEQTQTTDRDKLPTIEMPLPDAVVEPLSTQNLRTGSGPRRNPAAAAPAAGTVRAGGPVVQRLRRTLTNVRSHPRFGRNVPVPIAVGVVFALVAALLVSVVNIRNQYVTVPQVDVQAETRRARERELRLEGNRLLREGRVRDAYEHYEELSQLAPNSPAVNVILQKLSAIRTQEDIDRAQVILARQKLAEGIALVNQKKFSEAIPVLHAAASLNPTDPDAMRYLQLAQQEQARIDARLRQQATTTTATVKGPFGTTTSVPAEQVAQLTTSFTHPFSDGYIIVKVGGDTLVQEQLAEVTGRFIRRRTPRPVNVSRAFTPKNADLQVWIVVQSQRINEHHSRPFNFRPGSNQRLQITWNAQSRSFDYQIN
jgi:serine/threonine protein kinase